MVIIRDITCYLSIKGHPCCGVGVRFHTQLRGTDAEYSVENRNEKMTFRHRAPDIRIFCEHNRIICEIACFKTKTILDKDIIDIFQGIDNGDENTKVLEM